MLLCFGAKALASWKKESGDAIGLNLQLVTCAFLQTILNKPVEEWPDCDCLLSWHSDGFPLKKAEQYVADRRPFLVNDLVKQHLLLDRRKVYTILKVRRCWKPQFGLV